MQQRIGLIAATAILSFGLPGCGPSYQTSVGVHYEIPLWGPPYYSGVRYYYLPDIEAYYDLSSGDFVYLDRGEWLFSGGLPPMYSGYDLYGGYVIMLDIAVFEPWRHHQYYVSHYPKYYYHNVYPDREIPDIWGFNENNRRPIVWRQVDRDRIRDARKNGNVVKRPAPTRPPQKPAYYGKEIGRPVKVRPQMREKTARPAKEPTRPAREKTTRPRKNGL